MKALEYGCSVNIREKWSELGRLGWALHRLDDDVGTMMLATGLHLRSWVCPDRSVDARRFYQEAYRGVRMARLLRRAHKSPLEWAFLGHAYATGRFITRDLGRARGCFARAERDGHPTARHERIIAHLIDDRVNEYSLPVLPFGRESSSTRSALRIVAALRAASRPDAGSDVFLALREAFSQSICSDYGGQYFKVTMERVLKEQAVRLADRDANDDVYAKGIIEGISRLNPTGQSADHWFGRGALRGHVACAAAWLEAPSRAHGERVQQLRAVFGTSRAHFEALGQRLCPRPVSSGAPHTFGGDLDDEETWE